MRKLLNSNSKSMKLLRTIIQGLLAVGVQYLGDILGVFHLTPEVIAIATPAIMAILSPIMAALGEAVDGGTDG